MVTKAEFLFMIQSVNLPSVHIPSHPVHTAAHCNPLQLSAANHPVHIQCTHTAAAIKSLEHTAANLQCTLQPCTAMYSYLQPTFNAHCSYTIQCTLQLHYLVPIPYSVSSAPLNHHRVSLYHSWPTSRAVSRH